MNMVSQSGHSQSARAEAPFWCAATKAACWIAAALVASAAFAQTSASAPTKDNADAALCERQFREMEIMSGTAHQKDAMKEFCQTIALMCGSSGSDAACAKAKRGLPAALSQARKIREQRK